ncbi:BCCT family transporter [Halorussus ruber]|uniref:BCCT family transporter n=1 Tax=Halorussus ruber TaxID=1126238 RepID=UPI0010927DC8|nr:BCCT family transporter [Halorussus ruber]
MKTWYLLGLDEGSWSDRILFFVAMAVMLALGGLGFLNPSLLSSTLTGAKTWVLDYFGWWFILLGFLLLVVVLLMVFSRYGQLRIGGPDAEPEFGLFSWLSMVFTVGFGASILIWGVAEPVSIVTNPPPKPYPVQGASVESMALAFMFVHEVFPGLAMWYLPVAMAFGIIVYTDGVGDYKISSMLTAIVDEDRIPGLYWAVDLAAVVATIGGISTTLGFSAQTMAAILGRVFDLEATVLTYAVFALIGVVFLGDVWLGLRKGIRNAARVTMLFIGISMALLVVAGPTVFMFELGLDATGVWLSEMFRLMLYTAPTSEGNWAANWTGFWWAWWAAWSIFVGSFVARVSKGRTIREMFVVLVVVPTLLTWVQHLLIGGWVLAPGYQQPVAGAMAAAGKPAAIAKALQITSFGTVLAVLFVFVIAGYIVTSLDSAVFMISAITLGDENPNPRNRAWWGALLAFFGMMSLELEEFGSIQSLSVTMALPFSILLLVILYGSYVVAKRHVRNDGETHVESDTFLTRQSDSSAPSDD